VAGAELFSALTEPLILPVSCKGTGHPTPMTIGIPLPRPLQGCQSIAPAHPRWLGFLLVACLCRVHNQRVPHRVPWTRKRPTIGNGHAMPYPQFRLKAVAHRQNGRSWKGVRFFFGRSLRRHPTTTSLRRVFPVMVATFRNNRRLPVFLRPMQFSQYTGVLQFNQVDLRRCQAFLYTLEVRNQ
jgi:hypothetical protein